MIIILMGVSGCGKTTVGRQLAQALSCSFYDADDFHLAAAKEKMSRGIGLTDDDRQPWLEKITHEMKRWESQGSQTVLACSALKQKYRDLLSQGLPVSWVYLKGDKAVLLKRLENRKGHYASTSLLDSQLDALEEPQNALILDISASMEDIVKNLVSHFKA